MDFREMLYITTVADCRSITAAARKLYISQPSLSQMLRQIEEEGVIEEWETMSSEQSFELSRGMDGVAEVNGSLIDSIFARIDPEDPDSMRHFAKLLEDLGIIKALREFGVQDGQEVRLNGETFDFVE